MPSLLITGSRNASDKMIFRAFKAVSAAKAQGFDIIVGDAKGIDEAVIRFCGELGVTYDCYGITEAPRAPRCSLSAYHRVAGDFLARDRHMADLADNCLAIWNGKSRGTKYTYDYFKKSGKPCWLLNLGNGNDND